MMTKRSLLLPLMTTFDSSDTTQPCSQRNVSTVAPQALALLNNEFVHEQSDAFAARVRGRSRRGPDRASRAGLVAGAGARAQRTRAPQALAHLARAATRASPTQARELARH